MDIIINIVLIIIMEENLYKMGGLFLLLIIVKDCKVMIIKNIDILDYLVNGVIGIVQEICVDYRNFIVGIIFMKFGSLDIGREVKKIIFLCLKGSVFIKVVIVNFLLIVKFFVQVERIMFFIVLVFGIMVYKLQGSMYEFVIGDFIILLFMKIVMFG